MYLLALQKHVNKKWCKFWILQGCFIWTKDKHLTLFAFIQEVVSEKERYFF